MKIRFSSAALHRRGRALAALIVVLALTVVVAVAALNDRPAQPQASCGYVLTISPFPHWFYYCSPAGGGGIGSW